MPQHASDLIAQAETLYEQTLTPDKTRQIRDLFQKALAQAEGRLANIIICDYLNRWNGAGPSAVDEAETAAQRALQLDPNAAVAHHALGHIHRTRDRHQAAIDAFDQALGQNPGFARARAQKANALFYLGRFEEALREIETAIQQGAGHQAALGMFQWIKGRTLFMLGRYQDAVTALQQSIASWPDLWYNRLYLVSAYAELGQSDDARRTLDAFNGKFPGYTLRRVKENEKANPSNSPQVVEGREKFHEGLRAAGMAP